MDTISADFCKLRHENGIVDVQRRKSELTALVDALDPWELLYLRSVLRQRRIELAGLTQLPIELLVEIGTSLEPMDLVACASVCTSWRHLWTSEYVLRGCAKFFFPGFIETTAATNPQDDLWSAFVPRADRQSRRSRGTFTFTSGIIQHVDGSASLGSSSFFVPDPDAHSDGCIKLPHEPWDRQFWSTPLAPLRVPSLYSHGRVATQVDDCCVLLDDIYKRRRRLVSWPEGRLSGSQLTAVVLTEKLLVFEVVGKRALVVYHVDTQEFRKITVPARLQRVWAYNTTINMTSWSAPELSEETSYRRIAEAISPKTLDEDIPFIWRWGESLREIQALPLFTKLDPEVTAHDKRVANVLAKYGFFYHPWRNDTSFRATSFLKLPKGKCGGFIHEATVAIDEIIGDTARNRFIYKTASYPMRVMIVDHQHLCRPENSHGENTIFMAASDAEPGNFVRVSFNAVTKKFTETPVCMDDGYGFNLNSANPLDYNPVFWDNVLHAYCSGSSGTLDDGSSSGPSIRSANLKSSDPAKCHPFQLPGDRSNSEAANCGLLYEAHSMLLHSDDENLVLTTRVGYIVVHFAKRPEAKGGDWVAFEDMPLQKWLNGSQEGEE